MVLAQLGSAASLNSTKPNADDPRPGSDDSARMPPISVRWNLQDTRWRFDHYAVYVVVLVQLGDRLQRMWTFAEEGEHA